MKSFRDNLTEGKYLEYLLLIIAIILLCGSVAIGQTKAEVNTNLMNEI